MVDCVVCRDIVSVHPQYPANKHKPATEMLVAFFFGFEVWGVSQGAAELLCRRAPSQTERRGSVLPVASGAALSLRCVFASADHTIHADSWARRLG